MTFPLHHEVIDAGQRRQRIEWKPVLVTIVFFSIVVLNQVQYHKPPVVTEKKELSTTTIYSQPRPDRSGAFLQDMLFAHAFAFAHNYTYGGCCEYNETAKYRSDTLKLIESLGLEDILKFQCPNDDEEASKILPRQVYYEQDTQIWSQEWLSYIHGMVRNNEPSQRPIMAVHIRRGDVTVCPDQDGRYLPNQHYIRLMERYRPAPDTPVYIYSETESPEPWSDFSNHSKYIHLELDTPIEDVFQALMNAEILVMSKSSFSLVPAMLNRNQVIYTPFWHKSLSTWTVVPDEIMDETSSEIQRLRRVHGC